jgi:hypothetical protein
MAYSPAIRNANRIACTRTACRDAIPRENNCDIVNYADVLVGFGAIVLTHKCGRLQAWPSALPQGIRLVNLRTLTDCQLEARHSYALMLAA